MANPITIPGSGLPTGVQAKTVIERYLSYVANHVCADADGRILAYAQMKQEAQFIRHLFTNNDNAARRNVEVTHYITAAKRVLASVSDDAIFGQVTQQPNEPLERADATFAYDADYIADVLFNLNNAIRGTFLPMRCPKVLLEYDGTSPALSENEHGVYEQGTDVGVLTYGTLLGIDQPSNIYLPFAIGLCMQTFNVAQLGNYSITADPTDANTWTTLRTFHTSLISFNAYFFYLMAMPTPPADSTALVAAMHAFNGAGATVTPPLRVTNHEATFAAAVSYGYLFYETWGEAILRALIESLRQMYVASAAGSAERGYKDLHSTMNAHYKQTIDPTALLVIVEYFDATIQAPGQTNAPRLNIPGNDKSSRIFLAYTAIHGLVNVPPFSL